MSSRIAPTLAVSRAGDLLTVRFPESQRVASWAIVRGGIRRARVVAWLRAREDDLGPGVDPARFLEERLAREGLADTVGLLTSRDLAAYTEGERRDGELRARCIATVGLGNALRAGDSPGPLRLLGTINLLLAVSRPLTDEALLEALALAAEARTVAVLEARVPSRRSGQPASGTGTDCVVVAAPECGEPLSYIGKHTALGHLVGEAVLAAVGAGVEAWLKERGEASGPHHGRVR